MSEHECYIGLLHKDYFHSELTTLNELKEHIEENKRINKMRIEFYSMYDKKPRIVLYTLKDYADRRKSTDMSRFEFCPYCGKKINWKKIKSEETEV
jgi:rRNA maturation endonuclease Nob1